MKRAVIYAAALTVIIAAPMSVSARDRSAHDGGMAMAKMPSRDAKFMKHVARDGMAEVELGRLASQRASSGTVKQFTQQMITDHSRANDELMQLAEQKGVEVPTALDRKHKKAYDSLAKLSGPDFDRAYIREMARDHNKDLKMFNREATRAKDPDVKAWAAKTLPTLQQHQDQVKQTASSMNEPLPTNGWAWPGDKAAGRARVSQ